MLELATKQQPNTSVEGQFPENGEDEHRHHQPHHITDDSRNGEYEAPIHSNKEGIIKRKLLLLSPLLICLYILTDTTHHVPRNNNENEKQHLAFVTALSRHPPALRVFRIISESAFLLFCTAFALWAWEMCSSPSSSQQDNDKSLEQFSDLDNNHKNSETTISIPSQTVGKLLFSPPPNSITDNVAWMIYKKHHHRVALFPRKRKGRRKMNRQSNSSSNHDERRGDERSRDEDDLIELQQQHPKDEDDEQDVSPLMDTTPSRNTGKSALHDRLRDDHDDNYIENDENGNRNEHPRHNNTETTLLDSQEETLATPLPIKPPSSSSVLGAALDITTVMCMFLIFFTISSAEGGRYIDHKARGGINISPSSNHIHPNGGENDEVHNDDEISYMKFFAKIAAPLFPITLFLLSILLLLIPWRKRKTVWTIVSLTLGAPFYEVTFRDGFIGDILTSTVRPLQDLAYTVVFLFLGLQAWWDSQAYINTTTTSAGGDDGGGITTTITTTTMDDVPLERSWILHTIILPACTLSPLWWRFLQNLRQCYDTKRRWPYLGNAFKYMMAAEVAIFGMFDPSLKTHPVWIGCFFGATLYQVWWDVFMDWGLLVWDEDGVTYHYYHSNSNGSSGSGRKVLFWWWPYKLRSQRSYPHKWIYYIIFSINFCLRFVGMLTLIPPVYLSRRTGLIVNTWYDNADFQLFVGSLAALAEIFRRTIWALLRLEWEVIKTTSSPSTLMSSGRKKNGSGMKSKDDDDDLLDLLGEETDMKPMAISSSSSSGLDNRGGNLGFLTPNNVQRRRLSLESLSDMSNLNDIQILSELCAWATIFSGIAIIAAAHREVL